MTLSRKFKIIALSVGVCIVAIGSLSYYFFKSKMNNTKYTIQSYADHYDGISNSFVISKNYNVFNDGYLTYGVYDFKNNGDKLTFSLDIISDRYDSTKLSPPVITLVQNNKSYNFKSNAVLQEMTLKKGKFVTLNYELLKVKLTPKDKISITTTGGSYDFDFERKVVK